MSISPCYYKFEHDDTYEVDMKISYATINNTRDIYR